MFPLADGLLGFPVDCLLAGHFTFVVKLSSFGQSQFTLQSTALEVDAQRNKRQSFFDRLPDESANLTAVQEKLSGTKRIVIGNVSVRVRTDVTVQEPNLSGFDQTVGVFQIDPPVAGRLDFGAGQNHSGFESLKDFVVMKCLAIYSYIQESPSGLHSR